MNTIIDYIKKKKYTEVKNLVFNGFNVNSKNTKLGLSALHHAILDDEEDLVKLLLEKGANPNENLNQKLLTPLHITRNNAIVRALLKHKADPNIKDKRGNTPLHYIFAERTTEESDFLIRERYEILIENSADINILMNNGYSILHSAIINQVYFLIDSLVSQKVGFEISVRDIGTPLHVAISYQEYEIVKLLVNNNIPINTQRETDKWSPLILASQGNQRNMVELLLNNGADKNLKDSWGKMAKDHTNDKDLKVLLG